jgi:hypothetical protein
LAESQSFQPLLDIHGGHLAYAAQITDRVASQPGLLKSSQGLL